MSIEFMANSWRGWPLSIPANRFMANVAGRRRRERLAIPSFSPLWQRGQGDFPNRFRV